MDKILVIGPGNLSTRQIEILDKYFRRDYDIVKHIHYLDLDEFLKIKSTRECEEQELTSGVDTYCVDAVVFLKILPKFAVLLLKKDIEVYDFKVVPSSDGNGDLHGGKGLTVGLNKYELAIKVADRWYYV